MPASFFLGRILKGDLHALALWDRSGRLADDSPPEVPALGVEGAPKEHIASCKVLHGGGPGEPQIRGDRVAVGRQGPAASQAHAVLPGWGGKNAVKESHDKRPQ